MVHLDGVEFVRRFLLHVLPKGIKRIRHYGLLAPCKTDALAQAREALRRPSANPLARQSAKEFLQRVAKVDATQCPCCPQGRLRLVKTLKGSKTLPAPGAGEDFKPLSTGPPSKVKSWCHGWHDGTWVSGAGTPVLLRMIMLRRQIETCRIACRALGGTPRPQSALVGAKAGRAPVRIWCAELTIPCK